MIITSRYIRIFLHAFSDSEANESALRNSNKGSSPLKLYLLYHKIEIFNACEILKTYLMFFLRWLYDNAIMFS